MLSIPDETPGELMNPMSVEKFERLHTSMLGAIGKVVREELESSHADDHASADVQRPLDLKLVSPDVSLVFGNALDGIGQRDDGLLHIAHLRVDLRVIGRIYRFALHTLTSFLMLGGLIVALAYAASKALEGGEK